MLVFGAKPTRVNLIEKFLLATIIPELIPIKSIFFSKKGMYSKG